MTRKICEDCHVKDPKSFSDRPCPVCESPRWFLDIDEPSNVEVDQKINEDIGGRDAWQD